MSQRKQVQQSQDIDAGIERDSPSQCEPHREHDTRDRGGVYASEEQRNPPHVKPYPRKEVESKIPAPPDPDDPAAD